MISLSNIHITYELYFSGILGVSLYVPFGAPDRYFEKKQKKKNKTKKHTKQNKTEPDLTTHTCTYVYIYIMFAYRIGDGPMPYVKLVI